MDDNMIKDNLEDNSKKNSLVNNIIVHWKWDDTETYRTFLGIRYGGETETDYDLELKYPEESLEKETVLLRSDQIADLSDGQTKEKIMQLLASEDWNWDPEQEPDLKSKIDNLIS